MPRFKKHLFRSCNRPGYCDLAIAPDDIKKTILSHSEFATFRDSVLKTFSAWRKKSAAALKTIKVKDRPKEIIRDISDNILSAYADTRLIDKYDIYQHLMSYWLETMQDDCYILAADGWVAGNQVTRLTRESKGKKKDIPGLSGLEGRLIPIPLLIKTYFAPEQAALDELNTRLEQISARMDELKEEHGGEDGLLSEVINNDKIAKGAVQKRIKEIKNDPDFADELKVLEQYSQLFDDEAETKKAIKDAEKELEKKVLAKYPALTLEEVKTLVVDRKWMDAIQTAVEGEVDRLSQQLAGRVKELSERYQETLPEIDTDVVKLTAKVDGHIKTMGFRL